MTVQVNILYDKDIFLKNFWEVSFYYGKKKIENGKKLIFEYF